MKASKVRQMVLRELKVQGAVQELNVPVILGPPGIGKTAISAEIALELNNTWFRINVGDSDDPTSITGVPVPLGILNERAKLIEDRQRAEAVEETVSRGTTRTHAEHTVEKTVWALNRSAAAACEYPCTLLFDDIDKATGAIAKGLIGLFGSRSFRDFSLHPGTRLMGAGNRAGDDLLGSDLSESLLGRITIYEMKADAQDFAEYARRANAIEEPFIGFILANPKHLHRPLEPGEWAAPCPRSWKQASDHVRVLGLSPTDTTFIIGKKCGEATKKDWTAWVSILSKIDSETILCTGNLPDDSDDQLQYAACFAVAQHINITPTLKKAWVGLESFIVALPKEMRMAFMVQVNHSKLAAARTRFPQLGKLLLDDIAASVPSANATP